MTSANQTVQAGRADPLSVLHQIFEKGFATGDTTVVDDLCSPDLVEHQFGLSGTGAEAIQHLKDAIRDVHTAFPDMQFTVEDSVVQGDTVWVRVRARGTGTGPFFGPPSGRPVDICVLDVARVVDGRIVEHWGVPDRFATLVQTGTLERFTEAALAGARGPSAG